LLVGNDVVDLRDGENQPHAIHPRFDERVFDSAEQRDIGVAASPHRMRWALWAAKESAYKVARKMDPRVVFSPRAFSVRLPGSEIGPGRALVAEVRHAVGLFHVDLRSTDDWLHAVATVSGRGRDAVHWSVQAVRALPGGLASAAVHREASERVRRLARSTLASALALVPSDIVIAAAAKRAPHVWWRGHSLGVDLSLSHHGRYVACAWRKAVDGISRREPLPGDCRA